MARFDASVSLCLMKQIRPGATKNMQEKNTVRAVAAAVASTSAATGPGPTRGAATRQGRQPRAPGGGNENEAGEGAPVAKRPRGPGAASGAIGGVAVRDTRRYGVIANYELAAKLGFDNDDAERALAVYSLPKSERRTIVMARGHERTPSVPADLATLNGSLTDSLVTFVAQRLVLARRALGNFPDTVATLSSTLVRHVESARATEIILDSAAHLVNRTVADLLAKYVFAPMHVSARQPFVLFIFDRPQGEVLALDPLGDDGHGDKPTSPRRQTYGRRVAGGLSLQHVLREYSVPELGHVAFDAFTFVSIHCRNKHTARQDDGISCGVFVLANMNWFLFCGCTFPAATELPAGDRPPLHRRRPRPPKHR